MNITIIGAGNLGAAIARGLVASGGFDAESIHLTRRHGEMLAPLAAEGFVVGSDNTEAVRNAELVIVAVEPQHIESVLEQISPALNQPEQVLVSVVSGAAIETLRSLAGPTPGIVRAMPNTAVSIRQSMTCLAAAPGSDQALQRAIDVFDHLGQTLVIDEEQMAAATALGACGVAFFLRAVRAASQGGIEIGFSSTDALKLAAQTAAGAAGLLIAEGNHPEQEIDRVTTPRGCTIAGLNRMEHEGFSSAMITGITTSANKITGLVEQ